MMPRKEVAALLEQFQDQRKLWSTEGERGVRNLETICQALGYRNTSAFLEDNPGAIQAILDWVAGRSCPEFTQSLERALEG